MGDSAFIVPPPGLIPGRQGAQPDVPEPEPAVTTPVPSSDPEQTAATYPSFRPVQPLPSAPPFAASAPVTAPTAAVPPAAATPAVAAGPWLLLLGDGGVVSVGASVVIGRDPAVLPSHPLATLLPVTDATRSVSKTHALLASDGEALSVTDLHSTNGVLVTRSDGSEVEAVPDAAVALSDGDTLLLGEFVVRVTRERR